MKALVAHAPRDLRIEESPRPEPGPGWVRVDTTAIGICGSDIHLYRGDHPYRVFPLIYGHEFTGTIAALGAGVTDAALGEMVVVEPLVACGACYPCRHGHYNCCTQLQVIGVHRNGAFAESVIAPANRLHRVPRDLPREIAALCEPYSIGAQACRRGAITADDRVVVLGGGPIGLVVMAMAKQRGARVAIVDFLDNRLRLAREMGADLTINAQREDVPGAVRAFTDGDGAGVVVEATGSATAMESTFDLAAYAGRVVVVGVINKPVSLSGLDFTRKELTVVGSRNSAHCFADAVRFVVEQPALAAKLITHRFPFARAAEAFAFAEAHPELVCKAVVEM